jgi:hypothetical protein
MRYVSWFLAIFWLTLSVPVLAQKDNKSIKCKGVLAKGESIGTFEKIEVADYFHISIMVKGKEESFFCGPKVDCDKIGLRVKELKGEKLKVSWVKVDEYIPEAAYCDTHETADSIIWLNKK